MELHAVLVSFIFAEPIPITPETSGPFFLSFLSTAAENGYFLRAHALLQKIFTLWLQRASGANAYTLPTEHAGSGRNGSIEEGADLRLVTAAVEVQSKSVLGIVG